MESGKWTLTDVVRYLKGELDVLKAQRTTKQIELSCMSKEIDDLELRIFKIERECETE